MKPTGSGGKLMRNALIYSASGLLHRCFSFFLLPLYTAFLTSEDYGVISVATSFVGTMSLVAIFALHFAIKRFYVEYKEDMERLRRFFGTISSFSLLSGAAFFGILFALRGVLSEYFFSGIEFYPVILITLVNFVFECQRTLFSELMHAQQKAMKSSIYSLGYFFATVIFNILFVVVLKMGAVGSLLATLISCILYVLCFAVDMLRQKAICFCLDLGLLKMSLKYSLPIMPHNLSTHIVTLVSKLLIGNITSMASLGVYSIAAQFGNIADTVQSYVNSAYGPWVFERLHAREEGYKRVIRENVSFLSAIVGLMLIGIALFAQDYILLLVDPAYADAWRYVPLIVMVFAFKIIYNFHAEALLFNKDASRILFVAALSSGFVSVILTAILIPYLDIYGSIVADMVAMLMRAYITVCISRKYQNIGLRIGDFALNILLILIAVVAGLLPSWLLSGNTFQLSNVFYKIAIVLVYVAVQAVLHRKRLLVISKKLLKQFIARKKQ